MSQEKKINVWVFNQYASTPYNDTGAGERHFFIARELAKKGVYTSLFAASSNHLFKRKPQFKGYWVRENYFDFDFSWIKIPRYSADSNLGRVMSWLSFPVMLLAMNKKSFSKPDIIVVSSMSMFPILTAMRYKKLYKSKLVFEIRDIWPLTITSLGKPSVLLKPLVFILEVLEKWSYSSADHIVSVLPFAIDHIQSVTPEVQKEKFTWIPNGIEPSYANSSTASLKPFELPTKYSEAKVITYAGTLGIANAMEYYVEAIKSFKNRIDVFFLFVGEGGLMREYQEQLHEMDNVLFVGKVHKSAVNDYLNHSHILYIGWYNLDIYKFGVSANKYNDYMLAGKPLIVSSNIQNDPVDVANCGIKVKAESAEDIAKGIEIMLGKSEKEIEELGRNGQEYVRKNNFYSILALKYLNIYENLVNKI